jgi:hypothetical protein
LWKSEGSGTYGRRLRGQRGVALPTVLAAILVLTLIVAAMASRVRATLRAASLDADVAQRQALVHAAFNEVAMRFDLTHPESYDDDGDGVAEGAPDPTQPKPPGWQPCSPRPIDPAVPDGPAYCAHVLYPVYSLVTVEETAEATSQVPVMVRWRLRSSDSVNETFGWILYDPDRDVHVYYHHIWCRPANDGFNLCQQGG